MAGEGLRRFLPIFFWNNTASSVPCIPSYWISLWGFKILGDVSVCLSLNYVGISSHFPTRLWWICQRRSLVYRKFQCCCWNWTPTLVIWICLGLCLFKDNLAIWHRILRKKTYYYYLCFRCFGYRRNFACKHVFEDLQAVERQKVKKVVGEKCSNVSTGSTSNWRSRCNKKSEELYMMSKLLFQFDSEWVVQSVFNLVNLKNFETKIKIIYTWICKL